MERVSYPSSIAWSATKAALWESAWQAEVTNFDLAVFVDQDVAWLEVTMNDVAKMQRFEGTQEIIQNEFDMTFCQAGLSAHLDYLS